MSLDPRTITDAALAVALFSTSVGAGLVVHAHQRARRPAPRWLGAGLVLNVIGAPLLAAFLAAVLGLPQDARTGLIVVAACAGGLLGVLTTRIAGGDLDRAITLVLLLELLNVATVPLWTLVLLASATPVPLVAVIRPLVLMLLLPLVLGLLVGRVRPGWAPALSRMLRPVTAVAVLVTIAGVLMEQWSAFLVMIGGGLPLAGVLMLGAGVLAGHLLGGPGTASRRALGMVTMSHSATLALAVSRSASGNQPGVEAAIAALGLMALIVGIGTAAALRLGDRTGLAVPAARA